MNSELNFRTTPYTETKLQEIRADYPCIKESKLIELTELDPTLELFNKLVVIFKDESDQRIPEMKAAAKILDYKTVGQVTHRFRSTMFNLGAMRAAEMTKSIDLLIGKPVVNLADVKQMIAALDHECSTAYNILKTY